MTRKAGKRVGNIVLSPYGTFASVGWKTKRKTNKEKRKNLMVFPYNPFPLLKRKKKINKRKKKGTLIT
jgi:serine protease inhibitor